MISYADACLDPNLFGPWFSGETWATWRILDKSLFGDPLTDDERAIFLDLCGHDEPPSSPIAQAWLVMGRRSGKDVKAASIASYLATIGNERFDYASALTRGERGVVQLLAVDRDQAKVCLGYLKAFFEQPMLARLVARETSDGLELTNRLAIEITTNDQRRVRGRTVIAAVFDEVAFWRSDNSVSPDRDVYAAVMPAMATVPHAMLIGISSPYARKGLLWSKYKTHFGKPSNRVLVAQAPTWRMNPNVPRDGELITEAYEEDPASAAAEYGAQFRADIEDFINREAVEACIAHGEYERPRVPGKRYHAFLDPSGGSKDSFTLAIAHAEPSKVVLDLTRERKPPFSPEAVVEEFAATMKEYGITRAVSDRYAGAWPQEAFARHGITVEQSAKPKSELYGALLPRINSGTVELLDQPRLVSQLVALERRTSRSGRDTIDHPPGGHDDLCNAVAGAVEAVGKRKGVSMVDFL